MSDALPEHESRMTLLERAQLLHDATMRRHSELLDRHETLLVQMAALLDRHTAMHQDHLALQAQLADTLAAIKDMLNRGNGH